MGAGWPRRESPDRRRWEDLRAWARHHEAKRPGTPGCGWGVASATPPGASGSPAPTPIRSHYPEPTQPRSCRPPTRSYLTSLCACVFPNFVLSITLR